MLSSFDDFPVHQTSRADRPHGVGRPQPLRPLLLQRLHPRRPAVLRRGDGPVPEPPRRRRGVQRRGRRRHASTAGRSTCTPRGGRRPIAPTPTRSGRSRSRSSSRCTRSRLVVDAPEHGLRADLTFVRRSAPIEEPHFLHQVGVRVMFDYTRLTQFGGWEGWIEVDGELIDLDARRDVGIARPLVGRAPGRRTRPDRVHRSPTRSSSGCGRPSTSRRSRPTSTSTSCSTAGAGTRPASSPRSTRATACCPRRCGRRLPHRVDARHPLCGDWFEIDLVPWVGEPSTIRLEPLFHFQMLGIGYGHPEWAHGVWKGELAVGGDRWDLPIDEPDRATSTCTSRRSCGRPSSGGIGEHEGHRHPRATRHRPPRPRPARRRHLRRLAQPRGRDGRRRRSRVADGHAAVDGDGRAVDERSARQAQVERHVRDLLGMRRTDAAGRGAGRRSPSRRGRSRRSCRCGSGPGQMQLTVMPCRPSSTAMLLVSPTTPAFVAA